MTPERWSRVEQLYARAQLLPAEEWPLFLAGEAVDDIALVDVVLEMLRTRASRDFIEPPATGGAPRPAPTGDAWIGKKLGDCEIVAKLGQGGMGLVFRARQPSLKRDVALKILPFQSLSRPSHVARFEREARTAAQLNHKNLVKIHEVRVDGDVRWFTMELVEGPDLAHEIARLKAKGPAGDPKEAHLPPFESREYIEKVVELMAQAADALEQAHVAGVVHRDIKPGNLLIDAAGDVRIVDFGLARLDDRDERDAAAAPLTKSGDALGTLHYMSPEQVRRKSHRVDGRTDVWSLGVVLYELLTLEKPFDGATTPEIERKITEEEPTPLRKLAPRVPRDLEIVCATAMGREPSDRYSSAGNFRDDLRRFLAREAIVARPAPLSRRIVRHVGRRRIPYIAAAAAVVALAGGATLDSVRDRAQRRDGDLAFFSELLAMADLARDPAKVAEAGKRLAARERELDDLDAEFAAVVKRTRQRLDADRQERYVVGQGKLNAGMADRVDEQLFGRNFVSGASDREIGEALVYCAVASSMYPGDRELAELARAESGFPQLSIRLAEETRAAAPRAAEAKVWAVPIDDIRGETGPARELGGVPFDGRLAGGHWRIVVAIPEWGISEHSRYLVPSVQPYAIVARVQAASRLEEGMKRIEGGVFLFNDLPPDRQKVGRWEVGDRARFDTYWIDEAELSNREFVAYLEASGAPVPQRWTRGFGCKESWRELPLGDQQERWLDLPVVALTLAEATACAEWLGKRIPTQVELERAVRGPDSLHLPWEKLARREDAGLFNIDGANVKDASGDLDSLQRYLREVLPTRAEGYRQLPESLFHGYGNVSEITDRFLVEDREGRLIPDPWSRMNVGGAWDAALRGVSLSMREVEGITNQYLREYIGVRCARSAAAPR